MTAENPNPEKKNPADGTSAMPKPVPVEPETGEGKSRPAPVLFENQVFSPPPPADEILVILGSEEKVNQDVLSVLEAGGKPTISRFDKQNASKTLEQIFTEHPGIRFAVVILSADELVYGKNGKPADAKLRALQQAVYALGFLVSRLGRQNVFVLYREHKTFLFPTPMHHVMYTPYDPAGRWRKELASRMTKT